MMPAQPRWMMPWSGSVLRKAASIPSAANGNRRPISAGSFPRRSPNGPARSDRRALSCNDAWEIDVKLRLMENFRAVFYAPFYAIGALGFYANEGLDVELIESGAPGDAIAHLSNGTIDLTWGGPMRVMT